MVDSLSAKRMTPGKGDDHPNMQISPEERTGERNYRQIGDTIRIKL